MRLRPNGDETQALWARYRQAKETKAWRREGCQEVAASHSSGEAGERPIRTPWSEGDAALWTGSWNHAEDTVPHRRVTAKRPSRVRDSDTPQRDEPDALMCTSGSVGAVGVTPTATRPLERLTLSTIA